MNWLIQAALDHSRTVVATLVMIFVAGTLAFVQIPKESSPDINIPIIYARLAHPGISPQDAERLLVRPMEQQLRTIEGVKEMRSTAYEGGANVLLEFTAGFDADKALADVRERVDLARAELPAEAEEPSVHEVNFSLFPVLTVMLSGELPERSLLELARGLERQIEAIPNVLEVDVAGDRDELVEIVIDPAKVESYGLSADDLGLFIGRSNRLVAAGALDSGAGRFAIKVPGLIETVEDVLNLPIKAEADAVVRVRDVATVRKGFEDPEGFARIDGRPALALEVQKRIGANIIDTINQVRAVVGQAREAWPAGVEVTFLQDQSKEIRSMLSELENSVVAAVLLVMVVMIAVLGVRSGLLVGLAIPGSFLMGILVIGMLGYTINIVVLFSLILAVGMLVDDAIIVTEYADRKMIEGVPRRTAYGLAAKRMAVPVFAATVTRLCAFLPLLFWTGVVGEFMKFLPVTLVATLTASLLMALFFIPTLGAWFGKPGVADPATMRALAASEHGDLGQLPGLAGVYARVLRQALGHPGKVVLAALALLVATQMAYARYGKGVEFFPEVEPDRALVNVHARGNLSVHEKDALMREVEARVIGLPGIATVYARSGASNQFGQEKAEDTIGTLQLELAEWNTRPPARAILAEVRARTADLAGIRVETRKEEAGPPVGKPVQLQLSARYPELLPAAVVQVRTAFEGMAGLVDIEDSRPLPGVEWTLAVDRAKAARYGTDVAAVGELVKLVTRGMKFTDYRPEGADDEVDIVARFPEQYRTIAQLDRLRVMTRDGLVPIANFVVRTAQQKVGEITRVDGERAMTVKADVAPGVLADDMVRQLRDWLPAAGLDPRVSVVFKGQDQEQAESGAFLLKAFAVAVFLIGIIMVTEFNSFYAMLLVLSAVAMSTTGVMLGLLLVGQPFGIVMSGIGVVALAGIVVNNNIVLMDTYQRLRHEIDDPVEALLRTGAQRLRPVLLTAVTAILGLLPMILGLNIDFATREVTVGAPSTQWWTQLASAIAFGLAFATVLTLAVVPCGLLLRVRVSQWLHRRFGRPPPPSPPPPAATRRRLEKAAE